MPSKEGGGPLNNFLSGGDTSTRQFIPSHPKKLVDCEVAVEQPKLAHNQNSDSHPLVPRAPDGEEKTNGKSKTKKAIVNLEFQF